MRNALVWNTKLSWKKSSRRGPPRYFRPVSTEFIISTESPDHAMVRGDENEDPDQRDQRARIQRLRHEEKRLREQVARERAIVERMRAEKLALEAYILQKLASKNPHHP